MPILGFDPIIPGERAVGREETGVRPAPCGARSSGRCIHHGRTEKRGAHSEKCSDRIPVRRDRRCPCAVALAEKHPDKKTKAWAEALLGRSRRLFSAWHRRDEMTAEGFHRSMLTHRDRFLEIVRQPPKTKEAANLAARFKTVEYREEGSDQIQTYDCSDDYFRFTFTEAVEPTNNHTEQQLRHSVIDRRITQGTRGEVGQRYHERMWTTIATCKKQNRNFFTFLYESIAAQLQSQAGPSLLRV